MKKTHTLLNRHQLLDPVALRNWLAHNLDPVARADQLLTLRPEELNCIFDTLHAGRGVLACLPPGGVCRPSTAQAAWQHRGNTAGYPGPS